MNGHEERTDQDGARAVQVGTDEADPVPESEAKLAELEDRWLRAVAELDNVRKRIARDTERLRVEERDKVVSQWLPVLDNLERALSAADGDGDANPVIQGVRAVRDQAVATLNRLGYRRQDQTGVPFDPQHHEAVSTVERDDVAPGTVVEVLQPGYGDDQRQLRPAVVVVAKKAE
ncbi:nucleotide exchange factor GrpE [Nonomuraea sp. NEAU-A123]|uniref:nucleotide exchange factor GrpE n=1 Tax=Nonomuraea sp. NEAU-A123 TaxID=2839649 RepID=UPI001BE4BFF2|nr:nucleotide exchange factor GrpE [Nonomuraea sp. NEAU-A123]MBT2231872.1 nucleotide exchange factor GrpE [Nonomuraea sp. NEAU-A123]